MAQTDLKRRAFLRGKSPRLDAGAIRPPWALETSIFIEKCTRCDECIQVCPENIIRRGDGGYPEINFLRGECTFCAKCVRACQNNAFQIIPLDKLNNYDDDNAELIKQAWVLDVRFMDSCLSLNAIVCRACADNCDEQAINFQLKLGGISEPRLKQSDCTGCGACVPVCPVRAVQIKPLIDQNQL